MAGKPREAVKAKAKPKPKPRPKLKPKRRRPPRGPWQPPQDTPARRIELASRVEVLVVRGRFDAAIEAIAELQRDEYQRLTNPARYHQPHEVPIADIGLRPDILEILEREGYLTATELLDAKTATLEAIRGIGPWGAAHIREMTASYR